MKAALDTKKTTRGSSVLVSSNKAGFLEVSEILEVVFVLLSKYLYFSQSNTSWVFSHIFTTCSFIWPVNFSAASTPIQWRLYLKTKITQQKFTGAHAWPAQRCPALCLRGTQVRAPEQAPGKHLLHWLPLYHKKLYNIRQQDRNRYETPRTFRYQTSLGIPMQVPDWAAGKTSRRFGPNLIQGWDSAIFPKCAFPEAQLLVYFES